MRGGCITPVYVQGREGVCKLGIDLIDADMKDGMQPIEEPRDIVLGEGGECVGEVMDEVVGMSGDGYRFHVCKYVVFVGQEDVS